jgi:hypothetical protein
MSILWDLIQQRSIGAGGPVLQQAAAAEQKAGEAVYSTQSLHSRIDRLSLINRAIWELIQEKLGLSEKDLLKKVQEVDLRDGKIDGKVHAEVKMCPGCENVLSARHLKCIYCGAPVTEGSAFDKV